MPRVKAKITPCPNLRMAGGELRRLILVAGLDDGEVAERLGTSRMQIWRWEKKAWFELNPVVMRQLLSILNAEG